MAVAVMQEFESSRDDYDKVTKILDVENNPPNGCIFHCGIDIGGGKLRTSDVWETKEAFEKFAEERIGPAVVEVVGEDAPQPTLEIHEVIDVFKP